MPDSKSQEMRMFWIISTDLRAKLRRGEDAGEQIEEIEVMLEYTEVPGLRERCAALLAEVRPKVAETAHGA